MEYMQPKHIYEYASLGACIFFFHFSCIEILIILCNIDSAELLKQDFLFLLLHIKSIQWKIKRKLVAESFFSSY